MYTTKTRKQFPLWKRKFKLLLQQLQETFESKKSRQFRLLKNFIAD